MRTIRIISVMTLLLFAALPCFALVTVDVVSKDRAEKDLGATIRMETVGTNQVGVWLDFAPKGKLQDVGSVQLEIASAEGTLVSATLSPLKRTADSVVVYFSTTPTYLLRSRLTVYVKSGGWPEYGHGFQFNVSDFVKHELSR